MQTGRGIVKGYGERAWRLKTAATVEEAAISLITQLVARFWREITTVEITPQSAMIEKRKIAQ
jgi:hypothetical protein